jgi:hypothetical protein
MYSNNNVISSLAPLVEYRLFGLNARNQISGSARHIDAVDDESAIEMTDHFPDSRAVELWQADRLVFRLTPNTSSPISPGPRVVSISA